MLFTYFCSMLSSSGSFNVVMLIIFFEGFSNESIDDLSVLSVTCLHREELVSHSPHQLWYQIVDWLRKPGYSLQRFWCLQSITKTGENTLESVTFNLLFCSFHMVLVAWPPLTTPASRRLSMFRSGVPICQYTGSWLIPRWWTRWHALVREPPTTAWWVLGGGGGGIRRT